MTKGYWVSAYKEISDPEKLAAYAELAGPAIIKAGGKFLIRGIPAEAFEHGIKERTVVVEFETIEAALNAHKSADYLKALEALDDGAIRDFRIIGGIE
jgi:uncharacterized protein (DUF1330 family)